MSKKFLPKVNQPAIFLNRKISKRLSDFWPNDKRSFIESKNEKDLEK